MEMGATDGLRNATPLLQKTRVSRIKFECQGLVRILELVGNHMVLEADLQRSRLLLAPDLRPKRRRSCRGAHAGRLEDLLSRKGLLGKNDCRASSAKNHEQDREAAVNGAHGVTLSALSDKNQRRNETEFHR